MIVFEGNEEKEGFSTYLGGARSGSFAFVSGAEPSTFSAVN